MDDKITVIEGPTPMFEPIPDSWALSLTESPFSSDTVLTHLRTFNGEELVERCHRAWHDKSVMVLEYRNELGLEQHAPILAARSMRTDEGQVLVLWIRREVEENLVDQDEDDSDNMLE